MSFSSPRRGLAMTLTAASLVAFLARPSVAAAQDTTSRNEGVSLRLGYDPYTKPGVLVTPIGGAAGDSIRAIVQRDLDFGDRVTVLPAGGEVVTSGAARVNYALLAKIGAAAVVQSTIVPGGLRVVLHDVGGKRVLQRRQFTLPASRDTPAWRLAVHDVADEVEGWITGTRGVAATRILYVRDAKVRIVDSDGENDRPVTTTGSALSPTWHPNGRTIAYSVFGDRGTQVMTRDLNSPTARRITEAGAALNITPTFSPDGAMLVYSHGEEEGSDLFATTLTGGLGRRVTVGRGTDNVSPSFSPDGRRVAFTSGRSGHPEVYITDVDGTNAELLTDFDFGDQSYRSNPDWSPDGRMIAFQSQVSGQGFQVMTINLRDRSVKQHTSEGSNEDPSWAPDARHLVFTSTRSTVRQLYVLDTESGRVRQLTRGGGARSAAWSPPLVRSASTSATTAARRDARP